jgi:hypothetical protein
MASLIFCPYLWYFKAYTMQNDLELQPLPQGKRRNFFLILLGLFILTLPFLFLYATGYRFDLGNKDPFISTGGLYVAADRAGAEIYIDDELVRETRTFRTAFYAQGLEPGTHRVHVQKPGHHTWVKELPVYPHLVTEAEAFNVPQVPTVRTLSPWKNGTGATVVFEESALKALNTNPVIVATSTATSALIPDTEYATLLASFTATSTEGAAEASALFTATSTADAATTSKVFNGVQLDKRDEDIYATFVGPREQMPYYYCAKDFEFSEEAAPKALLKNTNVAEDISNALIGPVQYVPEDAVCEPSISIDRQGEQVDAFDFYPGSSDLVLLALETGIYVIEVDNRSWQNMQPLLEGENLSMRIQNGNIYVFDGTLIYQVLIDA